MERGGWSLFCTTTSGADCVNPALHPQLRANGEAGWFGWPTSEEMERERAAWLAADDLAGQRRHAEAVQRAAFRDVPFYPLGQHRLPTAYRWGMTGCVASPVPVLWNVSKSG